MLYIQIKQTLNSYIQFKQTLNTRIQLNLTESAHEILYSRSVHTLIN